MARFIDRHDDFEFIMNRASELIKIGAELPDYVFNREFKHMRVVDYARVGSHEFMSAVLGLCEYLPISKFWFVSLDPHPVDHYHRHFNKYGIIEFTCEESANDIIAGLWESPGENEVDALQFTNTIFALLSTTDDWCIWGDHDIDIALLGFSDEKLLSLFSRELSDQGVGWLEKLEDTLHGIMSLSFRRQKIPQDFRAAFRANYNVPRALEED